MTRHYIGLEDAKSVLDSRISHFATALKNAVQTWNDDLGFHHDTLDEFARGVIISQFWYAESLQAFRGDSGVQPSENGERKCFTVDDALALRFKHLDSEYRPRNSSTDRGRAWSHQMNFPGIPPMARLDFGYRMDPTGTIVETAFVMLNHGQATTWRWQVWGRQISRFAGVPNNMFGEPVYTHNDYSGVI